MDNYHICKRLETIVVFRVSTHNSVLRHSSRILAQSRRSGFRHNRTLGYLNFIKS